MQLLKLFGSATVHPGVTLWRTTNRRPERVYCRSDGSHLQTRSTGLAAAQRCLRVPANPSTNEIENQQSPSEGSLVVLGWRESSARAQSLSWPRYLSAVFGPAGSAFAIDRVAACSNSTHQRTTASGAPTSPALPAPQTIEDWPNASPLGGLTPNPSASARQ